MEKAEPIAFLDVLLPMVIIVFVIAVCVFLLNQHFQRNLFKQKLQQELLKHNYQNELLRSSIQAQEKERKRIAQDLHDELGASLSIAKMQLMQLERDQSPSEESARIMLKNVRETIEVAMVSTRRISHELMPPQLERYGLIASLEKIADQISLASQLKVDIHCVDKEIRMPWALEIGLYRVAMELLNNTIKHANASEISIELISQESSKLLFLYTDNGFGMSTEIQSEGLGLKNLKARVTAIGGDLKVFGNNGFQAHILLPI